MSLHVTMDLPADREELEAALEGLVALNHRMMVRRGMGGRGFPRLYGSGIVYRRERPGDEDWQPADKLVRAREGDCEDLAGYRAGELRADGELGAKAKVVETRSGQFHAVVQRANGVIEDPSRILLDLESSRESDGDYVVPTKPKITLKDRGSHYLGAIDIPMGDGRSVRTSAIGFDPWSALKSAVSAASRIMEDPAVQAVMPPAVSVAIRVADSISKMSPAALRRLTEDDRATDAQKKLAKELLNSTSKDASTDVKPDAPSAKAQAPSKSDDCKCRMSAKEIASVVLGAVRRGMGAVPQGTTGISVRDHRGQKPTKPPRNPGAPPADAPGTHTTPRQPAPVPVVDPATGLLVDPSTGVPLPGQVQTPYQPAPYQPAPYYPQGPAYYPPMYQQPPVQYQPQYTYPQYPYAEPNYQQAPDYNLLSPEEQQALMYWGEAAFPQGAFPDAYGGGQEPGVYY